MRPIFSPTDFIQIKGRGTRRWSFNYRCKGNGEEERLESEKDKYKLFDFFANCEYFEKKYNYDEILKLPPDTGGGGGGGGGIVIDEVKIFTPDPLKSFSEKAVGLEGMKVDRKFFEKFEDVIKNNLDIKERYVKGDIVGAEEYVKSEIFDKPEDYFNLEKLRKAVKTDRRISLREIIEKVFGGITRFKTKDELLEEECDKFIGIYSPENQYVLPIKNYLKAYITDSEIREIAETREYSRLATNPKLTLADLEALGRWRNIIPEYVKDYISLNTYM
jgi:type I restriction enzyme R subunit